MRIRALRAAAALGLSASVFGCAAPVDGVGDASELGSARFAVALDATVTSVDVLPVRVPERFHVPYAGGASAEFPSGLPLSLGSGLRLKPERGCRCNADSDGNYTLIGLSDRGPNGDAPDFLDSASVKHPSKSYLVPTFTPELVTVRVSRRGGAAVTRIEPLRFGRDLAIGLPPAALTTEVGVTESLAAYPASNGGIDPEGVDFDARGDAWIGEEYGPSLVKVRAGSGRITSRLTPGAGLPALLASRQVNRGFEGVAVTPSGKVYGAVQSTLDIAGKTKGSAQFIRVVEYDPKSGATRMFAYPHDVSAYKKSGDAKLGDLVALDDSRFLVLENGKDKDGNLRNLVYQFDLTSATDLTGVTLSSGPNAGKDLEYGTRDEVTAQVTFASKSLVVDLRAYGYTAEKSEGLALLDDRTLVVINDNDFGATAVIEGDATGGTDPTKYIVDSNGVLTFEGAASSGTYRVHALPAVAQQTNLFVVRLETAFDGYCSR